MSESDPDASGAASEASDPRATAPDAAASAAPPAPPAPAAPAPGWVRLAVIGAIGGLLSGAFGVGGGIVMVPLLMWLARMDQRRATATSLAAIVPASIGGAIGYLAGGQVDLLAALFVAIGGVVGSWIGARILRRIPLTWLRWGFIALLVVITVRLLLAVPDRESGHLEITVWIALALVGIGVAVGIASGLFGIGGGTLMVPVFIVLLGMGDLMAKGTSLVVMIPTAVSGTITNVRGGLVDLKQGLTVGLAATIASFGGVAIAFLIPRRSRRGCSRRSSSPSSCSSPSARSARSAPRGRSASAAPGSVEPMEFRFIAELWEWRARAEWFFVTVPDEASAAIREVPLPPRGFGSVRVRARVGRTVWTTSVFPDSAAGAYVLPIKKAVRVAEELEAGGPVEVELHLVDF
ncbi:TSUP family transporter [Agromyces protaetiae]|uniref:TSUP family transporter n=1 Tax=Agromyces protaetiae TaxID=2509455 RepID=UPI0013E9E501